MATVQSSNHSLARVLVQHATVVERVPDIPSAGPSLMQDLGYLSRVLLGALLLPLGVALVFTLWLMPVGLPLALLGVALIAAPRNP